MLSNPYGRAILFSRSGDELHRIRSPSKFTLLQQQQQHRLLSYISWGWLEIKSIRNKSKRNTQKKAQDSNFSLLHLKKHKKRASSLCSMQTRGELPSPKRPKQSPWQLTSTEHRICPLQLSSCETN